MSIKFGRIKIFVDLYAITFLIGSKFSSFILFPGIHLRGSAGGNKIIRSNSAVFPVQLPEIVCVKLFCLSAFD